MRVHVCVCVCAIRWKLVDDLHHDQGDAVSKVFLPQLIDLYRQGRFPFDKLITFYDSLEQVNQAIDDSHSGAVIKPVLRIAPL